MAAGITPCTGLSRCAALSQRDIAAWGGAAHTASIFNSPDRAKGRRSMSNPNVITIVRRDTKAWRAQVWISFFLAVVLCGTGLAYLPGADIDRAFMIMGYVFCLAAAFSLAKFIRDNENKKSDTPMWSMVAWGGFAAAMALTGWGLANMSINPTYKAFLGVSWLFLISNAFTLAKTLRDAHEAEIQQARLDGMRQRAESQ
jgi:hypothetical protein